MIYAYDKAIKNENRKLVHILDAVDHHTYFCTECNDELIARRGKVRPWHFSHTNNNSCSFKRNLGCILNIERNNGEIKCNSGNCCNKECEFKNNYQ